MAAFDVLDIAPLSEVLLSRFNGFDQTAQIGIIVEHPRKELVDRGLKIYAQAGSYHHAKDLGQSVVLSLAKYFTAADVKEVLEAVNDNGQIWFAHSTPKILEQLFDRTASLLPDVRPYWQTFVDRQIERMSGDASVYYAYPGLQERLEQNRSKSSVS